MINDDIFNGIIGCVVWLIGPWVMSSFWSWDDEMRRSIGTYFAARLNGKDRVRDGSKIGCLVSHVNVISSIEFWGHTGFGMHGKMVSSSQNWINQPESPSTWAKGRSTWSTWTQEANASHHSLLIEHLGHGPLPSWTDSAKFLPCVIETAQKLFWGCFIHSENDTRRWECYELYSTSEQQIYRLRIHDSSFFNFKI